MFSVPRVFPGDVEHVVRSIDSIDGWDPTKSPIAVTPIAAPLNDNNSGCRIENGNLAFKVMGEQPADIAIITEKSGAMSGVCLMARLTLEPGAAFQRKSC